MHIICELYLSVMHDDTNILILSGYCGEKRNKKFKKMYIIIYRLGYRYITLIQQ